jgi:hypothetical protein
MIKELSADTYALDSHPAYLMLAVWMQAQGYGSKPLKYSGMVDVWQQAIRKEVRARELKAFSVVPPEQAAPLHSLPTSFSPDRRTRVSSCCTAVVSFESTRACVWGSAIILPSKKCSTPIFILT